MNDDREVIEILRKRIPTFECTKGCHDCCGPVTASAEEMRHLPVKTKAEHEAALEAYNCVHLSPHGCTVYEDRPLICRLFGTTPRMACPNGCKPEQMVDENIEKLVHHFNKNTRQVLV